MDLNIKSGENLYRYLLIKVFVTQHLNFIILIFRSLKTTLHLCKSTWPCYLTKNSKVFAFLSYDVTFGINVKVPLPPKKSVDSPVL